jgi:acetylornithine deacetylase
MNSVGLLRKLVGFDTTSRESNLQLIEFVRDYLAGFDVPCELIYNAERSKANLFATIGPAEQPGIVLSGHTDVVPVDGQPWTVAPFELSEHDGKLFGRGTADMKGYIACVLALVPALVAADLRMPVHIALSYDEEVGCLGVRSLLAELQQRRVKRCSAIKANWRCAATCTVIRAIRPTHRWGSTPSNTPPS